MRYANASLVALCSLVAAGCSSAYGPSTLPASVPELKATRALVPDAAVGYKSLFSFGAQDGRDGVAPAAGLVLMNGTLYGTAAGGGTYGSGIVFNVASSGAVRSIYSFKAPNAADPDVEGPQTTLTSLNGELYGTSAQVGQISSIGAVFEVDPSTGKERLVYKFKSGNDGADPQAGLLAFNGKLYGTTASGGANAIGTVFELDPSTGAERVLYTFGSHQNDGANPATALTLLNGLLYGTTANGGTSNSGTVFSVNPKTGKQRIVYDFAGNLRSSSSATPSSGLVALHGELYGTTTYGEGVSGAGTVFAVNPSTGKERVLYGFNFGGDGAFPEGLIAVNGSLYGVAIRGGVEYEIGSVTISCGTVFEMSTSGSFKLLYQFKGASNGGHDGQWPVGTLVASNGALYGVTESGGIYGQGTVFRLPLNTKKS